MFENVLQSSPTAFLLVVIAGLLVLHFLYSNSNSQKTRRELPGPKALPLLGNVLQVDLKRLDTSLFDVSNV